MHPVRPRRFLRRASAYGVLAALIALVAISLSQCRMVNVDDSASGIGFATRDAGRCITDCNRTYNDSIRVESDRHVAAVRACSGVRSCLEAEELFHETAVNRIQAGRRDCQENCHHQGGGSGGR